MREHERPFSYGERLQGRVGRTLFVNRFDLGINDLAGATVDGHVDPALGFSLDGELARGAGVRGIPARLGDEVDHKVPYPGIAAVGERANG